mmetsp:Transcript_13697/g.43795  ORF Transcript_13697/g.43795 Transcript_13697/m.43795 type:complete len:250 (+) Transcript_13697:129-878(+)
MGVAFASALRGPRIILIILIVADKLDTSGIRNSLKSLAKRGDLILVGNQNENLRAYPLEREHHPEWRMASKLEHVLALHLGRKTICCLRARLNGRLAAAFALLGLLQPAPLCHRHPLRAIHRGLGLSSLSRLDRRELVSEGVRREAHHENAADGGPQHSFGHDVLAHVGVQLGGSPVVVVILVVFQATFQKLNALPDAEMRWRGARCFLRCVLVRLCSGPKAGHRKLQKRKHVGFVGLGDRLPSIRACA